MAFYKYPQILKVLDHAEFDKFYPPSARTPWSGIYRCEGCGREAISTYTHPLPPQNHHQHLPGQGAIRWRLIVTDSTTA
jgi:hypothetical protein